MLITPKKRKRMWAKISSEEASEALGDPLSERVGRSGRTRGLSLRRLNIKDQGKSPSAGHGWPSRVGSTAVGHEDRAALMGRSNCRNDCEDFSVWGVELRFDVARASDGVAFLPCEKVGGGTPVEAETGIGFKDKNFWGHPRIVHPLVPIRQKSLPLLLLFFSH
ncbi:hypothetical protein U1Q18_007210 [Sarracenia purpurea var. burkii]